MMLIQRLTRRPAVIASDRWPMARLSMIGVVASYVLGYSGIKLTTSSDASLLIIGEVIFTAVLAYILVGEKFTRMRVIGTIIGTIGAVILISGSANQNTEAAPNRILGDLLFLGCLACEAYYTVRGGAFLERNDSVSMLAWVNGISMFVWIPIIIWYIVTGQFPVFSTATILGTIYLALIPSVLCYFLWFTAVRRVGASAAAVALLAQPVVGAIIGIQVMGDPLTLSFIIGGVLILGALIVTSIPEPAPSEVAMRDRKADEL
jgi:drug/metabolite transporter (DMT)-like permease